MSLKKKNWDTSGLPASLLCCLLLYMGTAISILSLLWGITPSSGEMVDMQQICIQRTKISSTCTFLI